MILRRIEITGFKSFGAKTKLEFTTGVTAVVGPNGSGKSNLADAVRWVLGEQSRGKLRLESSEEIIFAGTHDKARASFAEVVMTFDNASGRFPVDLAEVEVARRLYRSGESEYRVCGRTATRTDLQALLLAGEVGAGSYTVIGQGMIDRLLVSSPAERKLLFDEAAGIRGPELKRESAIKQLAGTTANLVRLRDLAAELWPRLESLGRVVATADEQTALASSITELKLNSLAAGLAEATTARDAALNAEQTANQELATCQQDHERLTAEERALQEAQSAAAAARMSASAQLTELEDRRRELASDMAGIGAALAETSLLAGALPEHSERAEALSAEYKVAKRRLDEIIRELTRNATSAERAAAAVAATGQAVTKAQNDLVALRAAHQDGTRDQYLSHALDVLKLLASGLQDATLPPAEVKLLVHKAGRLLSHAASRGAGQLVAQIQAAQRALESAMSHRETALEHQTNITITRRSLEIDQSYLSETVARLSADLEAATTAREAARAARRHRRQLERDQARLQAKLEALDEQVSVARTAASAAATTPAELTRSRQLAVELDRLTARQAAAKQEVEAAQHAQAAAANLEAEVSRQAKAWDLSLDDIRSRPVPKQTRLELLNELAVAEATYAAKQTAQADQLAEYQALQTRHQELEDQIADLSAAASTIEAAIAELDTLIQQRFTENFAALAEQFSANFRTLFDGGTASLALKPGEDGVYGVEIAASPKGKRLSNLTSLSGGERALAGVALLAAILRVNPAPFVVLDEIDAALDEANSGRLSQVLRELADVSQLIVITHNRQTMEAASVLFGVTLSHEHTSQVLRVELDQARALAAR